MDMNQDPNDMVIVRATIGLAHNMGLSVIAEGVEDAATLQNLRALGCDKAQGYHILNHGGVVGIAGQLPGTARNGRTTGKSP